MTIEISDFKGLPPGSPANFPQMPTVGGDPVVESGSNTDGEWTKWADGTQQCHLYGNVGSEPLPSDPVSGGTFIWTFPVIFINSDFTCQGTASQGLDSGARTITFDKNTSTTSEIRGTRLVSDSSLDTGGPCWVFATGRWK